MMNDEKEKPEEISVEKPDEKPADEKQGANSEIQNLNSQILRLRADFDNFRKRAEKEKSDKYISGKESVLSKVIGFLDVFEKAIEMTRSADDSKKIVDGMELLKKEFACFLEKEGVKDIKCEGQKFDPFIHEAIGFEITDSPEEENAIIKEVSKGYMCNDLVLRHPKVIILKKGEKEEGGD